MGTNCRRRSRRPIPMSARDARFQSGAERAMSVRDLERGASFWSIMSNPVREPNTIGSEPEPPSLERLPETPEGEVAPDANPGYAARRDGGDRPACLRRTGWSRALSSAPLHEVSIWQPSVGAHRCTPMWPRRPIRCGHGRPIATVRRGNPAGREFCQAPEIGDDCGYSAGCQSGARCLSNSWTGRCGTLGVAARFATGPAPRARHGGPYRRRSRSLRRWCWGGGGG